MVRIANRVRIRLLLLSQALIWLCTALLQICPYLIPEYFIHHEFPSVNFDFINTYCRKNVRTVPRNNLLSCKAVKRAH